MDGLAQPFSESDFWRHAVDLSWSDTAYQEYALERTHFFPLGVHLASESDVVDVAKIWDSLPKSDVSDSDATRVESLDVIAQRAETLATRGKGDVLQHPSIEGLVFVAHENLYMRAQPASKLSGGKRKGGGNKGAGKSDGKSGATSKEHVDLPGANTEGLHISQRLRAIYDFLLRTDEMASAAADESVDTVRRAFKNLNRRATRHGSLRRRFCSTAWTIMPMCVTLCRRR